MGHKGQKSLLKAVLAKSTAAMAGQTSLAKYPAMCVYGLVNQYGRINFIFNINQMDTFISAIREISGGACVEVSMESVETDLRQHLECAITHLLATLQPVRLYYRPGAIAAFNEIDWRSLFRIEPQPPVDIVVHAASDDDSGGGGSLADAM